MPITITPTIADITINATTWTHADWEANTPGVISGIGNAIATTLTALGDTTGTLIKAIAGATTLSGPEAVNLAFVFTGVLGSAASINFPAGARMAVIVNDTTGGFGLSIGLVAGARVTIPASGSATVYCDGTNFGLADGIARTSSGASITGTFAVSGAVALASTLALTGAATLTAGATIGGTLGVTGAVTLASDLTASGTVAFLGATTVEGTLNVGLDSAFLQALGVGGDLGVTGDIICAQDIVGLTVAARHASLSAYLYCDSPDGTFGMCIFATSATERWRIGKNLTNDLEFQWFDSGGVYQASPILIGGANGYMRFMHLPTSSAGLDVGTVWTDGGTLKVA